MAPVGCRLKKHKPVKQKKRMFNQESYEVIYDEVDKLIKVGFIREMNYPECVSNVVMVKKENRKWKMCVNFINLNKSYSKDSFSS